MDKILCQYCDKRGAVKGLRYCELCRNSLTLEQKIQAQRDFKERIALRVQAIRNKPWEEVA